MGSSFRNKILTKFILYRYTLGMGQKVYRNRRVFLFCFYFARLHRCLSRLLILAIIYFTLIFVIYLSFSHSVSLSFLFCSEHDKPEVFFGTSWKRRGKHMRRHHSAIPFDDTQQRAAEQNSMQNRVEFHSVVMCSMWADNFCQCRGKQNETDNNSRSKWRERERKTVEKENNSEEKEVNNSFVFAFVARNFDKNQSK